MTLALDPDWPAPGDWTADDLDRLPEDGHRHELIDGVFVMSPAPSPQHQRMAGLMMAALDRSCPPDYVVTQSGDIRINQYRSLCPDVLVVTQQSFARGSKFEPHEVIVAVEIVSPGSKAMDRATKPALYAEAGIPYFWRVETESTIRVYTHELDPVREAYREPTLHKQDISLTEPWELLLPIAEFAR